MKWVRGGKGMRREEKGGEARRDSGTEAWVATVGRFGCEYCRVT